MIISSAGASFCGALDFGQNNCWWPFCLFFVLLFNSLLSLNLWRFKLDKMLKRGVLNFARDPGQMCHLFSPRVGTNTMLSQFYAYTIINNVYNYIINKFVIHISSLSNSPLKERRKLLCETHSVCVKNVNQIIHI